MKKQTIINISICLMIFFDNSEFLFFNFVTYPVYSFYVFWFSAAIIHLLSQMPYVNHYGVVVFFVIFIAPHGCKDFVTFYHISTVAAQQPEYGKFSFGEFYFVFIKEKFVSIIIYPYATKINFMVIISWSIVFFVSSELGFDSGYKFQWLKWFCNIIIRPYAQSVDFINILNFGSCKYYRKIIFLTYFDA